MLKIVDRAQFVSRQALAAGRQEQRDTVRQILERVQKEGDKALFELTARYDQADLTDLKAGREEFDEAYRAIDPEVMEAIRQAIANIRSYHERQLRQPWMYVTETGTVLGQLLIPLERVGVYVPGGAAAYPSSVMMNVIPAKVAGVKEIAMVSPPGRDGKLNPAVLVAAAELGVEEVYKVGGAQAIAALAFGTETIRKVDKIVGPGNVYVALAKREVFGYVDIDLIAGPSEVVILADETADPAYVAADLLAQAEHDPLASSVLVTPSRELAERVNRQLAEQLPTLPRKEIIEQSLRQCGAICLVGDLDEAFEVVNELAPEHLQILLPEPFAQLGKIRHAGAVFLGEYSPVAVGDYFAGPNHVLPTARTARFSSALSVDDFVKKTSVLRYSRSDMLENGRKIMALAEYEGFKAHARSIELRLLKEEQNGR